MVVKRLHLGEAEYMPNPVFFDVVLWVVFMGPGSQDRSSRPRVGRNVGSVRGLGRLSLGRGFRWQLVLKRGWKRLAQVSAAGSDIRETVSILPPRGPTLLPDWRVEVTPLALERDALHLPAPGSRRSGRCLKVQAFYSPRRRDRVRNGRRRPQCQRPER